MSTNSPWLVAALVAAPLSAWAQTPPADRWDGERETFSGAIERSLRANPQTEVALAEIERARGLLGQVRAASLPTLTANGSYTRLDGDRILADRVILGVNQTAANLQIVAPLVQPKAWVAWSHAQDNVKVAQLSVAEVRRQLALTTGHAYLTVLTQHKLVEVSRVARDAARAAREFAEERERGGVGNKVDAVRAAQEESVAETQLSTAQTLLARAREALGVLVASDGPVDAADDPQLSTDETLAQALDDTGTRADVRVATERKQLAHRVARDSWVDYLPLLSGVFQPFYQDPPSLTIPHTGWQAQLVLTIPLYDGGYRYGARRERTALERSAMAQLQATLRQAKSEVRLAFVTVQKADDALRSAREAARLARRALEMINIAFREGAATNLELIDAERQSRSADIQSALAEDASRQARLDLLVAAGRFPSTR